MWKHHRYSLLFKSLRLNVKGKEREREREWKHRHHGFWFEPKILFFCCSPGKSGVQIPGSSDGNYRGSSKDLGHSRFQTVGNQLNNPGLRTCTCTSRQNCRDLFPQNRSRRYSPGFLFFPLNILHVKRSVLPSGPTKSGNLGPNANLWPGPDSEGVGLFGVIKKLFQNSNN